jgi:hypothetical protein
MCADPQLIHYNLEGGGHLLSFPKAPAVPALPADPRDEQHTNDDAEHQQRQGSQHGQRRDNGRGRYRRARPIGRAAGEP